MRHKAVPPLRGARRLRFRQ